MPINNKVASKKKDDDSKIIGRRSEQSVKSVQPVFQKKKTYWLIGCISCCIAAVLLILVLLTLIAVSGFYEIPALSKIFYKEPQPARIVNYDSDTINDFDKRLNDQKNKSQTNIIITEEELTALLNENQSKDSLEKIQAVITPNNIELYIKIKKPIKIIAIAGIVPQIENEQLIFNINNLKVGSFNLPQDSLKDIEQLVNQSINGFLNKNNLQVNSVKLEDRKMVVSLSYFQNINQPVQAI